MSKWTPIKKYGVALHAFEANGPHQISLNRLDQVYVTGQLVGHPWYKGYAVQDGQKGPMGIFPATHIELVEAVEPSTASESLPDTPPSSSGTLPDSPTPSTDRPQRRSFLQRSISRLSFVGDSDSEEGRSGSLLVRSRSSAEADPSDERPSIWKKDPIFTQIRSALKEWRIVLHDFHKTQRIEQVDAVKRQITALLECKRRLMTAGTEQQLEEYRQQVVRLIEVGGRTMGLDMIPRTSTAEIADDRNTPVPDLFRMHCEMAERGRTAPHPPTTTTSPQAASTSPLSGNGEMGASTETQRSGGTLQLLLDVKAVMIPCPDPLELFFSLYSMTKGRVLTEEYCVRLTCQGVPEDHSLIGHLKTFFKDVTQSELEEGLVLVVRVLRVGRIRSDARQKSEGLFRRPLGCAVLRFTPDLYQAIVQNEGDEIVPDNLELFRAKQDRDFAGLYRELLARSGNYEQVKNSQGIAVTLTLFRESLKAVSQSYEDLSSVPICNMLDFPEIIDPAELRNDLYIIVNAGEFLSDRKTSGKNVELSMTVRTDDGAVVPDCVSLGIGPGAQRTSEYRTYIVYHDNKPTWNEVVRIKIDSMQIIERAHLFITARHCSTKSKSAEPFAFAWLPLYHGHNCLFIAEGAHPLVLYRYTPQSVEHGFYLRAANTLTQRREQLALDVHLVSTRITQDEKLNKLLKWQAQRNHNWRDELEKFLYIDKIELVKFLREMFDALFAILTFEHAADSASSPSSAVRAQRSAASTTTTTTTASTAPTATATDTATTPAATHGTHSSPTERPPPKPIRRDDRAPTDTPHLTYKAIVHVINTICDDKTNTFTNFLPILNSYVLHQFQSPDAYIQISRILRFYLERIDSVQLGKHVRACLKALKFLFKFMVRSWALHCQATGEPLDGAFKDELQSLIAILCEAMALTEPKTIFSSQVIALQNFNYLFEDLWGVFSPTELGAVARDFLESIHGFDDEEVENRNHNFVKAKLRLALQFVRSQAFVDPDARAVMLPAVLRAVCYHLPRHHEGAVQIPLQMIAVFQQMDPDPSTALASITCLTRLFISELDALVSPACLDAFASALEPSRTGHDDYSTSTAASRSTSVASQDSRSHSNARRSTTAATGSVSRGGNSSRPDSLRVPAGVLSTGLVRAVFVDGDAALADPAFRGEITTCFLSAVHSLGDDEIARLCLPESPEADNVEIKAAHMQVLRVAYSLVVDDSYDASWLIMVALTSATLLKLLRVLLSEFLRLYVYVHPCRTSFDEQDTIDVFTRFFGLCLCIIRSPHLQLETFSGPKRETILQRYGDMREEAARLLLSAWEQLGSFQRLLFTDLVEPCIRLYSTQTGAVQELMLTLYENLFVCEHAMTRAFKAVEQRTIEVVDAISEGPFGDAFIRLFHSSLGERLAVRPAMREQAEHFLSDIRLLLEFFSRLRNFQESVAHEDERAFALLKLMEYLKQTDRRDLYVKYLNQLVRLHLKLKNYAEAGLSVLMHARMLDFSDAVLPAQFAFPEQPAKKRKASLFEQASEYFEQDQDWERAIKIQKELRKQAKVTYDYARLGTIHRKLADLYEHIARTDRFFCAFFRVAFYGGGFSEEFRDREFLYKGNRAEQLMDFMGRMQKKFPIAEVLKSADVPQSAIDSSDGQYIHITTVTPSTPAEMNGEEPVAIDEHMPQRIARWHQFNDVSVFTFGRSIQKNKKLENEFKELWAVSTFYSIDEPFPSVVRRTPIRDKREHTLSPIQNAVNSIQGKNKQIREFCAKFEDDPTHNVNPFTMVLNGTIDAAVSGGVRKYIEAFCTAEYLAEHPENRSRVEVLARDMVSQCTFLERGLAIHRRVSSEAMMALQEHLEGHFVKIRRMIEEAYANVQRILQG